ncbi:MAG: TfoX/Sxy family protein [Clostridia bacterium]|nr:TfoX/Sxy family protein [Clostridia bacterium]MBR3554264.1 TfoX/Sxy family protein [Clostridia bacterium]
MASNKATLDFILDQLSDVPGVSYRAMMGEFILYDQGRVIGGIYDDRVLVKPTPAALKLLPDAPMELPYEGAKEMLLVEDVENRDLLRALFEDMLDELPAPKKKK